MGMTLSEIAGYAGKIEGATHQIMTIPQIHRELLEIFVPTSLYVNEKGKHQARILVELVNEKRDIVFTASGIFGTTKPTDPAFFKACLAAHFAMYLVHFEYNWDEHQVQPTVEIPVEDGSFTERQFERCIDSLIKAIDLMYPFLLKAAEEGVVDIALLEHLISEPGVEKALDILSYVEPEHRKKNLDELIALIEEI